MRLQIISDIHLEYRENRYPHIPRKARNIALLGDIGRPFSGVYARLIANLSHRFDNVIVVAGNHEYYSNLKRKITVGEIKEQIARVCGEWNNVHFLDNTTVHIDGVRILGTTLWTQIPPEMRLEARKKMNDYSMCFIDKYPDLDAGVPLAPTHTTFWHETAVAWLKEELSSPGYLDTPTIVLSHHAPYNFETSDPRFENNSRQCCYSTNLSAMFKPPIIAWAYGHTHHPYDRRVKGVRIVSNPLGYPGELPGEREALNNPCVITSDIENTNEQLH